MKWYMRREENSKARNKERGTNQPMPGGKTNIQTTDPPPDIKPNSRAIPELHKPQEKAKEKPREEHNEGGLQEHSLRLRKLLDGVECKDGLWKAEGVVVHTGASRDGVVGGEEGAALSGGIEEVAR